MDIQTPPFLELHNAGRAACGRAYSDGRLVSTGGKRASCVAGSERSGKSTFVMLITREVLPLHREVPPVRFRGSSVRPLRT